MIGKIFEWIANIMSWFEDRLVLRGIGMDMLDIGNKLGQAATSSAITYDLPWTPHRPRLHLQALAEEMP